MFSFFTEHLELETHSSIFMYKMKALLNLLLLSAVALLGSAEKWVQYGKLEDAVRPYVDKAITVANEKFKVHGRHLNFHSLIEPHVITRNHYITALFKTTTCAVEKTETAHRHRTDCPIKKDGKPYIKCVMCRGTNGEELIDCVLGKEWKKWNQIRDKCADDQPGQYTLAREDQ